MVTRAMLCLVIAAFAAPACAEATIELPNGAKCTLDDDFSVLACDNHIAVLPDVSGCHKPRKNGELFNPTLTATV